MLISVSSVCVSEASLEAPSRTDTQRFTDGDVDFDSGTGTGLLPVGDWQGFVIRLLLPVGSMSGMAFHFVKRWFSLRRELTNDFNQFSLCHVVWS